MAKRNRVVLAIKLTAEGLAALKPSTLAKLNEVIQCIFNDQQSGQFRLSTRASKRKKRGPVLKRFDRAK